MREWYKEHSKIINVMVLVYIVASNTFIAYSVSVGTLDPDTARRLKYVNMAFVIGNLALYIKFG